MPPCLVFAIRERICDLFGLSGAQACVLTSQQGERESLVLAGDRGGVAMHSHATGSPQQWRGNAWNAALSPQLRDVTQRRRWPGAQRPHG